MSRYSMEIKALLQKKRLNKSRLNPQTSFNQLPESPQSKTLKRCESASSLRRKSDISDLEHKYRLLQQNYQQLLERTRSRNQFQEQAKQQIEKLNLQHYRDAKEIQRLRSMLGFMPKNSQGTQTGCNGEHLESSGFSATNSTWHNNNKGGGQSTESGDTSDHKGLRGKPKLLKKAYIPSPVRRQFLQNLDNARSPHKSRSPSHKYRFIPSLPLK